MASHPFIRFICYIGIAYQLPGAFAGERANLLSSHLKAMGLLDSARIMCVVQDVKSEQWLLMALQLVACQYIPRLPAGVDHCLYSMALPNFHRH